MTAVQLWAPEQYHQASPEVRAQVCNGCGSAGWKGELVPDSIWFLNIREACCIHDWMYTVGITLDDKDAADRVFLNNMLRIIDAAGGMWLLRDARRTAAHDYYDAVHLFGGPAFWAGKNRQENLTPLLAAA
jgi:hypothetical protein